MTLLGHLALKEKVFNHILLFFLENIIIYFFQDLIGGSDYESHCAELLKQSKIIDYDVEGICILLRMTFPNRNADIVAGTVGPVTYYLEKFCPFMMHRQFVRNLYLNNNNNFYLILIKFKTNFFKNLMLIKFKNYFLKLNSN